MRQQLASCVIVIVTKFRTRDRIQRVAAERYGEANSEFVAYKPYDAGLAQRKSALDEHIIIQLWRSFCITESARRRYVEKMDWDR